MFDVIEEYRAPFGDRAVIGMLERGFDLELDAAGRNGCRRKLIRAFYKQGASRGTVARAGCVRLRIFSTRSDQPEEYVSGQR